VVQFESEEDARTNNASLQAISFILSTVMRHHNDMEVLNVVCGGALWKIGDVDIIMCATSDSVIVGFE
jgi:hypothetical protein